MEKPDRKMSLQDLGEKLMLPLASPKAEPGSVVEVRCPAIGVRHLGSNPGSSIYSLGAEVLVTQQLRASFSFGEICSMIDQPPSMLWMLGL